MKSEIKNLENVFPKTHQRFQIISSSIEELSCKFLDGSGRKHTVNANIASDSYPEIAPVWFSESDCKEVINALDALGEASESNNLTLQAKNLVENLCKEFNLAAPNECLEKLIESNTDAQIETEVNNSKDDEEDDIDEDDDEPDDFDDDFDDEPLELEDIGNDESKKSNEEIEADEIQTANMAVLEKIKLRNRQEHLQGSVSGSVQANDRLMKELKDVYKSPSYKSGTYQVSKIDNPALFSCHQIVRELRTSFL